MRNEKGQFVRGHKLSEKSRKRISQSLIGNTRTLGYRHTKEAKEKMSEAKKGHKNRLGMKNTDEWRRKFKKANSGKNHWNWKGGQRRECRKIYENKRRARKLKNGGTFTLQEWKDLKKKYGYMCPACSREEPDIRLTVDHIIPLSKGGSNYIKNIQPLCGECNNKKHLHIVAYEKNGQLKMII